MRMENETKVSAFLNGLDAKSKAIISHLLIKRHARINELSGLINENDALTLIKMREVINPLAAKIFGKPILVFKENAIDAEEGRKILFSWWLENAIELVEEQKKELFDVFDEKDFVRIVMELPGCENVSTEISGNELIVTAEKANAMICKKISLNVVVKKICEKTFKNSVLEIKLEKEKENELCYASKQLTKS